MSDESIALVLKILRGDHDERLAQYIVLLHQPDGWSLRQIAAGLKVSPEWVRQLELKGMEQIASGDRKDLTGLPRPTKRRAKTVQTAATYLPPETVEMLRTMNTTARAYRGHKGPEVETIKAFNRMVQLLLDAGVPIGAIARALDEREETFYKRMRRWGVHAMANRTPPVSVDYCKDASCPIPGKHVHG